MFNLTLFAELEKNSNEFKSIIEKYKKREAAFESATVADFLDFLASSLYEKGINVALADAIYAFGTSRQCNSADYLAIQKEKEKKDLIKKTIDNCDPNRQAEQARKDELIDKLRNGEDVKPVDGDPVHDAIIKLGTAIAKTSPDNDFYGKKTIEETVHTINLLNQKEKELEDNHKEFFDARPTEKDQIEEIDKFQFGAAADLNKLEKESKEHEAELSSGNQSGE